MTAVSKDPKIPYWHVWVDDEGVTHQTRCALSGFKSESVGGDAAPEWIKTLLTSEATLQFYIQPVGWVGEWHKNPKPQWLVPLTGRWFVETMDGQRVEMGPGEVSFGGDQTSKPDAQGRCGHRSGTIGDELLVLMAFQLEGERWTDIKLDAFA
jgi:hypothetical protein